MTTNEIHRPYGYDEPPPTEEDVRADEWDESESCYSCGRMVDCSEIADSTKGKSGKTLYFCRDCVDEGERERARVKIYHDPITKERLEGEAELVAVVDADYSSMNPAEHTERWRVRFDSGETVVRTILAEDRYGGPDRTSPLVDREGVA